MSRWPDLSSLELLADVAELGSLGRAAQRAGISQPSASVRIRNLERRLGVTLLVRDTRGSQLTPAGELVVGWAGPVLASGADLMRGVAALRAGRGSLTVAASLTIAEYLLPGWLARWQRDHPQQSVQLHAANSVEVIEAVLSGSVRIGFVETPALPARISAVPVGADRIVLVAAADHPWARRRDPVSAAELREASLLLREKGSGTRETFERALGASLVALMELSTTSALRGAALAGGGVAVISELAVREDLAAGRLAEIQTDGLDLRRRLQAVWPRDRQPTGQAAELLAVAQG